MLKEVGASGQISLGKKYAGQLFDVVFYPDGRVELVPMKVVPTVKSLPFATQADAPAHKVQEEAAAYRVGDGWLTPEQKRSPEESERLARQWASENQGVIDSMNQHYDAVGSMGWRIYEWRKKQAALADAGSKR